jgi:lysophospholipase L1-like esterase
VAPESSCHQGVLAFGDSITHGGGGLQRDIATQSWALWTARGLGLPFTGYAVDGARTDAVVESQIPRWRTLSARPEARYDLGCLYSGVNDVRAADWDPAAFAVAYEQALGTLAAACERVLVVTLPLDLGRPRAVAAVEDANRAIEAAAGRHGALVVDLRDFRGREYMAADHIHPTAFGQIEIAERALGVLARAGFDVRARPTSMIIPAADTPLRKVSGEARYAGARARASARAGAARLVRRRRAG